MDNQNRFVVLKFGGTSVESLERWQTIASVTKSRIEEGLLPVLVCSAISGATNLLEDLLEKALVNDHEQVLQKIRVRHETLASAMGVDATESIRQVLDDLGQLSLGISLVREISPRVRARALAAGELLSTRLGAAYLKAAGLNVSFQDARDHLVSLDRGVDERGYLSVVCDDEPDPTLQTAFADLRVDVIVTQGFIASHPNVRSGNRETVLLGRGGSDTSAAYFAARLEARRCEIWTDVPGVYTANPKEVPDARLLRYLDYEEAQEIATTGAKVLHPRCLLPLKKTRVPVELRCTIRPELQGTRIAYARDSQPAAVKAVSLKGKVLLVSMDTLGMWQQVGFLADVFACFKKHHLSVDLVSTSETNVTASVDASAHELQSERLEALLLDLQQFCRAKILGPCAAISVVGRHIRAILHRLGPALQLFEEHRIHLVSQAASDLNFTVVVDEDQAERLVNRLHSLFFGDRLQSDSLLGPTWEQAFADENKRASQERPAWWRVQKERLLDSAAQGTPVYVYDAEKLDEAAHQLTELKSVDRVFFAMKANPHKEILQRFYEAGLGFECVSPGELELIFQLFPAIDPKRILFTPNFAPQAEYKHAFEKQVWVNVDNIHPLQAWPDVFRSQEFLLRLDPGQGRGHHAHVKTAGAESKFGVSPEEMEGLHSLLARLDARVIGLHSHCGSGIRDWDNWAETALFLVSMAEEFSSIQYLDVGGGLGIVEKPGQKPLDLKKLDASLAEVKKAHSGFEIWLEPGRFLVASAGVLLASCTQTKKKGDVHYVGLNAGMHNLIRPALYGSYHEIVNLSRLDEEQKTVAHIVGPICETGDTLGHSRQFPETKEDDIVLIATAGAYGQSMSSNYNLREAARDLILDKPESQT
jgi:bifunctional diaminopimelate decarboxylase / aspartate kinase